MPSTVYHHVCSFRRFHVWITLSVLIAVAVLISGCDLRDQLPPSSIAPICKALIGPIKYNTKNTMSKRYAAYLLSLDLKQRNRVGVELGCPKFK